MNAVSLDKTSRLCLQIWPPSICTQGGRKNVLKSEWICTLNIVFVQNHPWSFRHHRFLESHSGILSFICSKSSLGVSVTHRILYLNILHSTVDFSKIFYWLLIQFVSVPQILTQWILKGSVTELLSSHCVPDAILCSLSTLPVSLATLDRTSWPPGLTASYNSCLAPVNPSYPFSPLYHILDQHCSVVLHCLLTGWFNS